MLCCIRGLRVQRQAYSAKLWFASVYESNFAEAKINRNPFLSFLKSIKSTGKKLHLVVHSMGHQVVLPAISSAVQYDKRIWKHPDTHVEFDGLVLPFWKQILVMAAQCFEISNLGYLGVDIVLDEKKGPVLLEMNARPGLGIQIANRMGLLPRLKLVDQMQNWKLSPEDRTERVLDLLKQRLA